MSNAGYGNHDDDLPGSAEGSEAGPPKGKPGATAASPAADTAEVATPGDGAGPTAPQGDEVDPGAG